HASRRQSGQNRERVNEALVKDAEDEIDYQDGHADQQAHTGERRLKRGGSALEAGANGGGQNVARHFSDAVQSVTEGNARSQIEGDGYCWQLPEVRDGERGDTGLRSSNLIERHQPTIGRADVE